MTPSPDSITRPVVHPDVKRDRTALDAIYIFGVLKVSNMIWVILSLSGLGLRRVYVSRTGCSSGATRSLL